MCGGVSADIKRTSIYYDDKDLYESKTHYSRSYAICNH